MSGRYRIIRTSGLTSTVEDIPVVPHEGESGERSRRILRAEIVTNKREAEKPVKITILHQRRHSINEGWHDADAFNLATLKAGEEVRLLFSCSQTHQLMEVLQELHRLAEAGLPSGERTLEVYDPDHDLVVRDETARHVIRALLEEGGERLWSVLDGLRPGLLKAVALKRKHEDWLRAIELFRKRIDDEKTKEGHWQRFFEQNEWVFGEGLDYRYLRKLHTQANYGGAEFDNKGAPVGDFLMATKARVGFTVLVEIKTPTTELLGTHYRNRAYQLGPELTGGIAQLQAQCRLWGEEGARQPDNLERLSEEGIYTYQPKGLLVIGNTKQLLGDPDKRSTFELFRRNLHNPEVVTFDELLQRAELMVKTREGAADSAGTSPSHNPSHKAGDDLSELRNARPE